MDWNLSRAVAALARTTNKLIAGSQKSSTKIASLGRDGHIR